MAKGKRAAALFEVIQAAKAREDKRLHKSKPAGSQWGNGGLRTPGWWFKNKNSNSASAERTSTAPLESIVSREIPAEPPPQIPAAPIANEAKRSSLIGALFARSKRTSEPPTESQLLDASDATTHEAVDDLPAEMTAQTAEMTEPVQDFSRQVTEQSSSQADEPIAEPAQPMMRLADDIVDNEEALDFGDEAPRSASPSPSPSKAKPQAPIVGYRSPSPSATAATTEQEIAEPKEKIAPDHKPVKIAVDRQHQQLSLRITYTSAAIGAFGFIVVIAMAFIIGHSLTHGPAMAGASSIDALRKGKAFPQVLEVGKNSSTPASNDGSVKAPLKPAAKTPLPAAKNPLPTATPASAKLSPTPAPPTAQPAGQPNTPLVFNGRRIVGMQYVWIQSYPDPEDANDAVAVLKKAGIDATAEKNLWIAPSWTTVIGTRAFDHTRNNPDYQAYLQSIQEVSENFAGTSKFKRFDPRPIGWKEQ